MRKTNLRQWLASGAAAGALSLAFGAYAQAEQVTFTFDQPAMPMPAALQSIGRETGVNILVDSSLIKGLRAGELRGQLSADDALVALLDGTGLTVRKTDHNSVMIVRATDPQASGAAGGGAEVEALIVTAQKREEDIQDVPIAISAFTQEALERSQIAGGPDLMTQVPNMTFTKTNFSSYSIQIRGIGTQAISATVDPAVAVAFNNTPFVRNRFFEQEFYDLQRVEVLRGPQGTLYGRNATAGVVNLIPAKPTFAHEARLSADVANYASHRLEGMINMPLVEDAVAVRLAGAWTKRDGYAVNELTGNPIDGRDLWSTRLSLRVDPGERFSANLIWEHFEEDDARLRSGKQLCKKDLKSEIGGFPMPLVTHGVNEPANVYSQGCAPVSLYSDEAFQTPNGYSLPYYLPLGQFGLPIVPGLDPYLNATQSRNLRVIESTLDPKYRAKTDLAQLQLSWDIGERLTLISETAYSTDFIWSFQDYNRFTTTPQAFGEVWVPAAREGVLTDDGFFCDPQLGCSDRVLAADLSTAESTQFSQEIRLTSSYDGPFNFSLGANYIRYDTEEKYYIFINTLTLVGASRNVLENPPPPWVRGVSDNADCLLNLAYGDSSEIQRLGLSNCLYIDPNPVDSLNDKGHNYFLSKNPYKLISYAAFGEGYYEITPTLKFTAGLRFTVDQKHAPQIPSWVLAPQSIGYPVREVVSQEWREPTGRLTIDWKPILSFTDETLVYASYARGYKAGGANPPPATVTAYTDVGSGALLEGSLSHPKTFDPEFIDAFEVGAKNTLFDGRMTLNLGAYYYDYQDYQISQIIDRAAINYNFDAEAWGAELEVDWRPIENLKLGFKGGYQGTRVADGMQAIDVMDRTAGTPGWVVARPFPTVPSNCILPTYVVTAAGRLYVAGETSFPTSGPCLRAYQAGMDPVTGLPYVPNPEVMLIGDIGLDLTQPLEGTEFEGYIGFDPSTAPNNGEGFAKELGGNELPNAPRFTVTGTIDYTVPLPNEWLMTLHADLYMQSKAWTRIFNLEPYDRLKPYTNVNLAAIFTNENAGWKVMAYVKNIFDRDNITGAFLNSDDTGLTTNVFLNEPRLYGLRLTREWSQLPWSIGSRNSHGVYPLMIELGGSILRQDAPNQTLTDDSLSAFSPTLLPASAQDQDMDWGDGREVRVSYSPPNSAFTFRAAARFGEANLNGRNVFSELGEQGACLGLAFFCENEEIMAKYPEAFKYPTNSSWVDVSEREQHTVIDFSVGREIGFGTAGRSQISAGLKYARLMSDTEVDIRGIPDWHLEDQFFTMPNSTHTWYDGSVEAKRNFEGLGPTVAWDHSRVLLDGKQNGRVELDVSLTAGVLFGKQRADIDGDVTATAYEGRYNKYAPIPAVTLGSETASISRHRSRSASVATAGMSIGLSYVVDRFEIGAGYRAERFFDAIDGGDRESRRYDRTIDGPYFKIAVGFGG